FFFFSSRRRHTSSLRDWSSDVCSSDLEHGEVNRSPVRDTAVPDGRDRAQACRKANSSASLCIFVRIAATDGPLPSSSRETLGTRSEERRVGKDCRYGGSPDQYNIKSID